MSKCKLCGATHKAQFVESLNAEKIYCPNSDCTLNNVMFFPEQYANLIDEPKLKKALERIAELESGKIHYAIEGAETAREDMDDIAEYVANNFLDCEHTGIVTIEQFRKLPSFDIRVTDKGDGVKWGYVEGEGK